MSKRVVRAGAVALGTVLSVCALAAPAAAEDVVPAGCVGTIYYACTGDGAPAWWEPSYEVPVTMTTPGVPLLPGMSVGGQEIGGVVIPVGGQTVPGRTVTVGPTSPINTGIVTPTQVCAFVTCIPAGTPVIVPGIPLPVVPVNIPAVTVPSETVAVPVIATVPTETTPEVGVPAFDQSVTSLRIYEYKRDYFTLAERVCSYGGGHVENYEFDYGAFRWKYRCSGGHFKPIADLLIEMSGEG